jgi:hypothetical protein
MTFLANFFRSNSYPVGLFYRKLNKFLNNIYQPISEPITVSKKVIYITFPYLNYMSDKFEKNITELLTKFFPHVKFVIVFKNHRTIGSFFRSKERLSERLRAGVVYQYSCDRCKSSYIGSTCVQFLMRQCQHAGLSHRTFFPLNTTTKSSIRDHCKNSQCTFKNTNFKIIDSLSGGIHDLRILESLHITTVKPKINEFRSATPLNIVT